MNNLVNVATKPSGLLYSIFKGVTTNIGARTVLGMVSAAPIAFATVAAEAAQVQITPSSPKLGDTISVMVTP